MNNYNLKILLFIPIIWLFNENNNDYDNNNNLHIFTIFSGGCVYLIYNFIYTQSVNNVLFALIITPKNYINPIVESHKLIAYGVSTIHAIFISLYATLYLFNIIDNYAIKQAFFISMSYYLGDLYYVITSTKKLTKLDYFTMCHHSIMIYYLLYIFTQTDPILENQLLYYLNRGFIAEYSVPTLNYSWYLVNTQQGNSSNMLISSILTLILYFITRIVNFTILAHKLWFDEIFLVGLVMMPLFIINYYWFYKLMSKAYRVYQKNIQQ